MATTVSDLLAVRRWEGGPGATGSIHLISGPMFSGKTSELTRRLRVARAAKLECLLVRPPVDTRWGEDDKSEGVLVRTHAAQTLTEADDVTLIRAATLAEARKIAKKMGVFRVVGIDEGQFMPDLTKGCELWAAEGARVIVAALDGTYEQTEFNSVSSLYPHCEEVVKLVAVCMRCHERWAPFTARKFLKDAGRASKGHIDIGGADKYEAVCRKCLTGV